MEKSYSAERRSQGVRKSKFVGEVLGEPDRDVRIIFAGSEKGLLPNFGFPVI